MQSILGCVQDIEVEGGCIKAIRPTSTASKAAVPSGGPTCNLRGSMVLPTFVDLHTHIGACHLPSPFSNTAALFAESMLDCSCLT